MTPTVAGMPDQVPPGVSGPASEREGKAAGTWLELAVIVDQEAVEVVSEILSRVAPGGVSVEVPFDLLGEGLTATPDADRPATLRAYIPALDALGARSAIDQVSRDLGHLQAFGLRPIGELTVSPVHEEDWAAAWKVHFPVLRVGERMVIRPTWRRHRARKGDVVIALDPGMAFGTGLHPTTRLCLAGLERWSDAGRVDGARVLDVGTGSGILAIAAALLGARSVLGLDTDPIAVEATTANARRNRQSRRVVAARGSVPVVTSLAERWGPFDLVLANLIASLLVELAPALAGSIRPGGRLLASGIFIDRESDVVAAFEAVGLRVEHREQQTDWVVLDVERSTA